ncbi:MAG: glycosyltransferase, partial [Acidobacteriota bacterium]
FVSRFEPENNPHRVVETYLRTRTELPLVMVGDAPYANEFISAFRARAAGDPRILLPGAIYGDGYRELQEGARIYIQATEVGGTHPALVEAMGYGNCLFVNDVPENREAAGDAAVYFNTADPDAAAAALDRLAADDAECARRGQAAAARARETYSWDAVSRQYSDLFAVLAGVTP